MMSRYQARLEGRSRTVSEAVSARARNVSGCTRSTCSRGEVESLLTVWVSLPGKGVHARQVAPCSFPLQRFERSAGRQTPANTAPRLLGQWVMTSRPAYRSVPTSIRARRLAFMLAVVAVSMLPGCRGDGGGPAGPSPVIAGTWSGTAYAHTVSFEATFTQSGQTVGGTGHFSSPIASDDFTVTGTLDGADVDLLLTSSELGATVFRGRFT